MFEVESLDKSCDYGKPMRMQARLKFAEDSV